MDLKIELKDEVVQEAAENIAKHLNNCTRELRRLYLVEDYVDSLKVCLTLGDVICKVVWFFRYLLHHAKSCRTCQSQLQPMTF